MTKAAAEAAWPEGKDGVAGWLEAKARKPEGVGASDWLEYEQRKHEKLLAA